MAAEEEAYSYKRAWDDQMAAFKQTWRCHKCQRYCPNCAGRSCVKCCIKRLEAGHLFTDQEIRDTSLYNQLNLESAFFVKRDPPTTFAVDPEWSSEAYQAAVHPRPLMRPPWPWEQPRYDPNLRLPTTYLSPAEHRVEEDLARMRGAGGEHNFGVEVPPLSYHLRQYYKTTHPNYILRY